MPDREDVELFTRYSILLVLALCAVLILAATAGAAFRLFEFVGGL